MLLTLMLVFDNMSGKCAAGGSHVTLHLADGGPKQKASHAQPCDYEDTLPLMNPWFGYG